jgi:hypothetical protein
VSLFLFRRAVSRSRGGIADRNRRLALPSFALQRGHSSDVADRVGLYTVSRHVGQFRYAMLLLLVARRGSALYRAAKASPKGYARQRKGVQVWTR